MALVGAYGDGAARGAAYVFTRSGTTWTEQPKLLASDGAAGDFFGFSVERTAELDELQEGAAVRYRVRAELAGRLFEEFVLDVGFDVPPDTGIEVLRGPDLLAFADIPPVEAPALGLETQIAEKLHAYTRAYGRSTVQSTRVKDLIDLALIATSSPIDAAELRLAIDRTFAIRRLQAVPQALPPPPADWRVPFRRMAIEVGVDEDLDAGHQVASLLLDPVLDGSTPTGVWAPMTKRWTT